MARQGTLRLRARGPSETRLFATAERGGGGRPGLAVAGLAVGTELRAERDQGGKISNRLHRAGLGDAHEPVGIEVVAVQQGRVLVDRRGYQLDPANVREALRECELDVAEGADALLVKPALPNLDVLRAVRERFDLPVGAYNVSGEYAMLKAAGARGWLDDRQAALESLTAIKRAGADLVVSYWTKELAGWL